jgi:hypothetical protein
VACGGGGFGAGLVGHGRGGPAGQGPVRAAVVVLVGERVEQGLQTRLQRAADEAAHHGRSPGPVAAIRRGRQRRRRLLGGTASLIALVLVAGALGTGRLASSQTPLAPAPTSTTSPTATSVTQMPAAVKAVVPLDIQVHLGPAGLPDRLGGRWVGQRPGQ